MKRAELAFLIGIFLTIALTGMVRFYAAAQSLGQETLRLHILANSDSGQDQQLKLKVRDRLLEEGGQLFLRQDSLSGAEEEVQAHLDEIEALCDRCSGRRGPATAAGPSWCGCILTPGNTRIPDAGGPV